MNHITDFDATSMDDFLKRAAGFSSDRIAVQDSRRSLDWKQLHRRLNRVATALINQGLMPGDRVAILAGNSVDYIEAFYGAQRAGASLVPLPSMVTPESWAEMLNDSQCRFLFVGEQYVTAIAPLLGRLPCLQEERVIHLGTPTDRSGSLEHWIADAADTDLSITNDQGGESHVLYSSGTTGKPKGIVYSRKSVVKVVENLTVDGLFHSQCKTLVSTPLYSGATTMVVIPTLAAGGTLTIMEKFTPKAFLSLCNLERITHALLVPVQYQRILADPDANLADLSSFEFKMSTSAPLPASTKQEIISRWPNGGLVEFFTMSEGGISCVLDVQENPDKVESVGQPTPNCVLKVIDQNGKELPRGSTGEIIGHSDLMMEGYLNRKETTLNASWFDDQGRRFHRSGDLGWIDNDGFLHLSGRKKDMIISGGFNIYPLDLEEVLLDFPGVAETSVIGIPSVEWGETPVAFVVLEIKPEFFDKKVCLIHINSKLGKAQRISEIHVVKTLPRSPIGKVLKRILQEKTWQQENIIV